MWPRLGVPSLANVWPSLGVPNLAKLIWQILAVVEQPAKLVIAATRALV